MGSPRPPVGGGGSPFCVGGVCVWVCWGALAKSYQATWKNYTTKISLSPVEPGAMMRLANGCMDLIKEPTTKIEEIDEDEETGAYRRATRARSWTISPDSLAASAGEKTASATKQRKSCGVNGVPNELLLAPWLAATRASCPQGIGICKEEGEAQQAITKRQAATTGVKGPAVC